METISQTERVLRGDTIRQFFHREKNKYLEYSFCTTSTIDMHNYILYGYEYLGDGRLIKLNNDKQELKQTMHFFKPNPKSNSYDQRAILNAVTKSASNTEITVSSDAES